MNKLPILCAAIAGGVSAQAQQAPQNPNVIMILADDLGYGDLSCYGATAVSTPNVDGIAREGIRFTDAHTCASTSTPSRYGLLTGEYPWRRAGTGIAPGDAAMIIKPDKYTLPKMFKQAGYTTAAVGKWHLGLGDTLGEQNWNEVVAPGPKEIGFDYSYIMAATADRVPCVFMENQKVVGLDPNDPIEVNYKQNFDGEPTGKEHPELLYNLKPSHGHDMSIVNGISRIGYMKGGKDALWKDENIADSITTHAVRFIERHRDNPFFLYLATNDIHVPRFPHERFRGKTDMGLRGDAIVQFDWTVGEIIKTLKDQGLLDNTIVIITSDNGPVVDDGYADEAVERLKNHKPWGPFRGGKYSSFEAGTRVPFIVYWPGMSKDKTSPALVSQIDMLGTFAALLNVDVSQVPHLDTQNQLGAWSGQDLRGRDYVIEASNALAVSNRDWKYISPAIGETFIRWQGLRAYMPHTSTETGNSKDDQLYNLRYDRGEYDNVATDPKNKPLLIYFREIIKKEKAKGVVQPL